jgi:predicted aminopeptidase
MIRKVLLLTPAVLLASCSNLGYYAQAVGGHLSVMRAARPIQDVLLDPTADPVLKQQLNDVFAVREFASRELGLPDNDSYRAYADLGRPFVVWNVFAAPELSVKPESWCMAFVGCVSYRGYYAREDAERYATELRAGGHDTSLGGVPAYSTLGYMNDPVLNTFLRFGDTETARTIFHELAHQQVFASNDSVFNESFATAVENEGLRRWYQRRASPQQYAAFVGQQRRKAEFIDLVDRYRRALGARYAETPLAADARRAKAETFTDLQRAYAELKTSWGGYAGYDKWFGEGLNNAKLASLGIYTQLTPAFEALLAQEQHDLPRFYRRVAVLAALPPDERSAAMKRLLPATTLEASVGGDGRSGTL